MTWHRQSHAERSSPAHPDGSGHSVCYRIAGRLLRSDRVIALLEPLAAPDSPSRTPMPPLADLAADSGGQPLLHRHGWAGDQRIEVSCTALPGEAAGYRLEINNAGALIISSDGALIEEAGDRWLGQEILGPALVLALALHGTWCLHASAAAHSGGLIAFLGETEAGKSTLARFLTTAGSSDGWQRVADDILPVSTHAAAAMALPHFRQPGLAAHEQYDARSPEQLPLSACYQLMTGEEAARRDEIAIEPLSAREAVVTLVRHTLGAGLLGRQLLRHHLACCADLVTKVPVRRLWYPRRWKLLPEVAAALARDLERA